MCPNKLTAGRISWGDAVQFCSDLGGRFICSICLFFSFKVWFKNEVLEAGRNTWFGDLKYLIWGLEMRIIQRAFQITNNTGKEPHSSNLCCEDRKTARPGRSSEWQILFLLFFVVLSLVSTYGISSWNWGMIYNIHAKCIVLAADHFWIPINLMVMNEVQQKSHWH